MYKIFSHDNSFYVYDAVINKFTEISSDTFKVLSETGINNEVPKKSTEIKNLYEDGFFQKFEVKNFSHPSIKDLDYYLNRNLQLLTLQLTQDCNLRCSYCPYTNENDLNRKHGKKYMSSDIAHKAIDYLWKHSIDSQKVSVGFYGGEPLLNRDLLITTTEYAKEKFKDKDITFTITTNGTLLDDKILSYFQENEFNVVISMDGPRDINDANRKYFGSNASVFEKVSEKISLIYEKYPRLFERLLINMVLSPSNSLEEYNKLFFYNEAINKVKIQASTVDDEYSDTKYVVSKEFSESYGYYKQLISNHIFENKPMPESIHKDFLTALFYRELDGDINGIDKSFGLPDTICPSGPCIPGHTRWMVDVNGDFYPCERVSETIKENVIGNITDGFDLNKVENVLNIHSMSKNKCLKCFAFRHCDACVRKYEKLIIGKHEEFDNMCSQVRSGFENSLRSIIDCNRRCSND